MSNTDTMFTLMATSALSDFRAARLLKRIREIAPAAQGVSDPPVSCTLYTPNAH